MHHPGTPKKIEQLIEHCYDWLQEANQSNCGFTRIYSLKVAQRRGEYVIRSYSCHCQANEFILDSLAIADWQIPVDWEEREYLNRREIFLDIPTVIDLVNFYLYQTFNEWQGHSHIEIAHRGNGVNSVFGFRCVPSIWHGKNLFSNN